MQEIEKSRNLNKMGNKKKVGILKMQEIRISRKSEKVINQNKVGNPKTKEIGKRRKSVKFGKAQNLSGLKNHASSLGKKKNHATYQD